MKNLWKPRSISCLHCIYQKNTSRSGKDAILDLASPEFGKREYWVNVSPGFSL